MTDNTQPQDTAKREPNDEPDEYPPYACDCCGVVNGDMFWDYIEHNADTLTYGDVKRLTDEFESYRKQWNAHAEVAREAVRAAKPRKPYKKRYVKSSPYWDKPRGDTTGEQTQP